MSRIKRFRPFPVAVLASLALLAAVAVTSSAASPTGVAGCPITGPDRIALITPPAHLNIEMLQSVPTVATSTTQALVLRIRITSSCGGPVGGALVYVTATPFNQFSIPPEATTAINGWATLTLQRLSGYPVSSRQQLIAIFVRARKAGEDPLAGISARRLMSIRVDL